MSSNVAIEILIEDDEFTAPEAKKVARTIIVKIPGDSSFQVMAQKISEKYPDIHYRVVSFYFYARNGKKNYLTSLFK